MLDSIWAPISAAFGCKKVRRFIQKAGLRFLRLKIAAGRLAAGEAKLRGSF
jgi:hypothetical protein